MLDLLVEQVQDPIEERPVFSRSEIGFGEIETVADALELAEDQEEFARG